MTSKGRRQSSLLFDLISRIESREARVGVIGLGYVGLPVAVTFAEAGFHVLGIDTDRVRVDALMQAGSIPGDVQAKRIASVRKAKRLTASTTYRKLAEADVMLICVPTPLHEGNPDLSRVVKSAEGLAKVLRPGSLVILESTTYPGTTEEIVRPVLEAAGLRAGKDFLLAFSPERIDPGNPVYDFADIPKVVGGMDEASTKAAAVLYERVVPKVVTVSGTREAEFSKLIENTFRHVNIALVNELAVYAHEMGIDIWEAIEAAATKPFGFVPFWPGPGWGGHCIPLDPAYLSWRVRQHRAHEVRFVELAHAVNSEMPRYVLERIGLMLNDQGKAIRGARIVGIGAAYKGGTEDTRESPALKVLSELARRGADLSYHDPLVPEIDLAGRRYKSRALTASALANSDLVVVLTPQVGVDWELIARDAPFVLDCCNALGKRGGTVTRL
jgi:UDP-N-acetyl-D-glucosamine dehydrogenase